MTTKKINWFSIINGGILAVLALVTFIPFYYVVIVSFSDLNSYLDSASLIPRTFQIDAYLYVLKDTLFFTGLKNTLTVTVVGTLYNMFITTMLAYTLSKQFAGRNFMMNAILFTMFFSGGMIPFYLTVTGILKLSNSLWAIILAYGVNTFYLMVMKNYFSSLPKELEESAKIDGANDIVIFFQVILPVSTPIIATFFLFYAVDRWNEWFNAMLFMRDNHLFTLQLVLRDILITLTNMQSQQLGDLASRPVFNAAVKSATIVFATVPIMCLYPFLQKHFTSGMMVGAIKS